MLKPDELTTDAVRGALRRVLGEPSFAAAARKVQAEIEAMPTPEEVARAVEAHVARG